MENIIILIRKAQYHEAKALFDQLSRAEQRDLLIEEASLTDSICVLGFAEYLISLDNTSYNHMLAAEVLIQMCWLTGAYNIAFYHAREMYRINPNTDAKKFLLFFYGLPEKIMPEEYALEIAKDILRTDPDYEPAKNIIQKCK